MDPPRRIFTGEVIPDFSEAIAVDRLAVDATERLNASGGAAADVFARGACVPTCCGDAMATEFDRNAIIDNNDNAARARHKAPRHLP